MSNSKTIFLLGVLAFAACGRGPNDDSNATVSASELEWLVGVDWLLGGADAQGSDIFGAAPLMLGLGPQGSIYALDGGTQEVRVFDASGAFVREFGRRGEGPGEFESAQAMVWDDQHRLWVADIRRYIVFDSLGSVIKTIQRPFISGIPRGSRLVFDGEGALIEVLQLSRGVQQSTPDGYTYLNVEPFTGGAGFGFVRVDTSGSIIEELPHIDPPRFDLRNLTFGPAVLPIGDRLTVLRPHIRGLADLEPFVPRTEVSAVASGVWFAHSNSEYIVHRAFSGDTIATIAIPYSPPELTRAEEQLVQDRLMTADRERSEFAYGRQSVRRIAGTESGRVLVLVEESPTERSDLLYVIDQQSQSAGEVRLGYPVDTSSTFVSDGETIVWVTMDEFDAKSIVKATLQRSGG